MVVGFLSVYTPPSLVCCLILHVTSLLTIALKPFEITYIYMYIYMYIYIYTYIILVVESVINFFLLYFLMKGGRYGTLLEGLASTADHQTKLDTLSDLVNVLLFFPGNFLNALKLSFLSFFLSSFFLSL